MHNTNISVYSRPDKSSNEGCFYIIPGTNGPRWIVPCDARTGLKVLISWRPYSTLARVKWWIATGLYRVGALRYAPGVSRLYFKRECYEYGACSWGEVIKNCHPVIYVGTYGEFQKFVITYVDTITALPKCVVKVPYGHMAKQSIVNEANTLEQLSIEDRGLNIPKLFSLNEDRGVSVQSIVEGRLSSERFTERHVDVLLKLINHGSTVCIKSDSEPLIEALNAKNMPTTTGHGFIKNTLLGLDGALLLPSTWEHGDFTPWNIKIAHDDLALLDWEAAVKNGVPLQDICHFFSMQEYLLDRTQDHISEIISSSQVNRYISVLGIRQEYVLELIKYYHIKSWCKSVIQDPGYAEFSLGKLKGIR